MATGAAATAPGAEAAAAGMVNGPGGLVWDAVGWRRAEGEVRRLRQTIFKASQAGDLKKARNLQKLMLGSRSSTLVSVRQVTGRDAGRKTAGIDGQVALSGERRAQLVVKLQHQPMSRALPVKRVHMPKKGEKQRPLGIPVIADRVQQARVRNALEPERGARLEPRSYGFRPGRSCHDAIVAVHQTLKGPGCQRVRVLDADLSSAFDRIGHDRLLGQTGLFPARGRIRKWLKAGAAGKGRYSPTEEGTPQGGVISPLLLNIALHGTEEAAGVRYRKHNPDAVTPVSPVIIRYAGDYVALCRSRQQAEEIRKRLQSWLAGRGLSFNEEKTQIVHASDGFGFPGFNVRRCRTQQGGKLLVKPGKEAIKKNRQRLSEEMRLLRGAGPAEIIRQLNPVIRGWAAYCRPAVASEAYHELDDHVRQLLCRWARRRHPAKPWHWAAARYFGMFNHLRQDRRVSSDRDSGACPRKFAWTKIVRHVPVQGTASPDDPCLARYRADRRRKRLPPPLAPSTMQLIRAQRGRCQLCGSYLLHADREPQSPSQREQWFKVTGKAMVRHLIVSDTTGQPDQHRLVHAHCRERHPADPAPARQPPATPARPSGLLEPDAVNAARPVLKGRGAAMCPRYPITSTRC
jgi:RNA-directed DNA polymerase